MKNNKKYKIITHKYFDTESESEIVHYYIKRKILFTWWYKIDENSEIDSLGTAVFVIFIAILLLLNLDFHIMNLYTNILYLLTSSYLIVKLCNLIARKKYKKIERATEYINSEIRKSNYLLYNKKEEIEINFNNGKIEIKQKS